MKYSIPLISFYALAFMTGHAGDVQAQRYPVNLEHRIDTLESKLDTLSRQPVAGGNAGGSTSALAELTAIREEMRRMRGEIEENRYAVDQVQRQMKLMAEDMEFRIQALENSGAGGAVSDPFGEGEGDLTTPSETEEPQKKTDEPLNASTALPAPTSTNGSLGELRQPPIATAPPAEAAKGGMEFTDPQEHYNFAVTLIKQQRYDRARESFQRFINMHPTHRLTSNAYYWMGETYYVNSNFIKAADTFREGFEHNPEGLKAADNLYKLAKSLIHMDKRQEACIVLKQIQNRYRKRNPEVVGLAFETEKANSCQ